MIWEARAEVQAGQRSLGIRYFVTEPTYIKGSYVPCYGIGISDGETCHFVAAFCPGREEALDVARLLWRMEVTPVTFFDVLEDYLAGKE